MEFGRNVPLCALVVLGLAVAMAPAAEASPYIVTFAQSGSNVVANGSGAIDTSGLASFDSGYSSGPYIYPSYGSLGTGTAYWAYTYYPIIGPSSFGTGGLTDASSSSGQTIDIDNNYELSLPSGYISGTSITSSATWDNATFSSLGVTPGTYKWTWGSGPEQSFTLDIGAPSAVPEPPSILLLATGLVGLGLNRRRRRNIV